MTAARETGRVLGDRYRLIERIDEGGAGEVWLARDERLGRDVAVKLLGAQADAAFRERFTEEARRAAVVSHPNVVTVFDEGQDGLDAYMVMEHVRGRTLRDVSSERGPLAPIEAARIVAQVADALDAAHEAGVIHCDVKPANVILDERGIAKLTDFGIARAARGPVEHELIATPRYIAPERIGGAAATPASDIYGLGLVAYELMAGRPPFDGIETEDLLRERLEAPPPSLRRSNVAVPVEVDLALAKALAVEPERRYRTAGAFARDLLAAARGERTRTMPVALPPLRALPRGRAGPRVETVVAVLAVVIVTLAVILFLTGSPQSVLAPHASTSATASARTPNVIGKNVNEAARILLGAGFRGSPDPRRISWTLTTGDGAACSVVRQEPAADAPYQPGAVASLVLIAPREGSC